MRVYSQLIEAGNASLAATISSQPQEEAASASASTPNSHRIALGREPERRATFKVNGGS